LTANVLLPLAAWLLLCRGPKTGCELPLQRFAAEAFRDDPAFAVQQEVHGDGMNAISGGDGAGPASRP